MKKEKLISTDKLRLAKVKYFDVKHNGVEVTGEDPYVFLLNINNTYINLFDPVENLPVYDRLPYSNTTKSGVDFGSKIVLKQGEERDGLCYVIENTKVKGLFNRDLVSIVDIENYMIHSDKFFIDRRDLLLNNSKFKISRKLRAKYYNDVVKGEEFEYFVNSHNNNKKLIKM